MAAINPIRFLIGMLIAVLSEIFILQELQELMLNI